MDGAERRTTDDEDGPNILGGGGFEFDPFAPNDRFNAEDRPSRPGPRKLAARASKKFPVSEDDDEAGESDDMVMEGDGPVPPELSGPHIIYDDIIVEGADLPEGSYIEEVIEEEYDPATGELDEPSGLSNRSQSRRRRSSRPRPTTSASTNPKTPRSSARRGATIGIATGGRNDRPDRDRGPRSVRRPTLGRLWRSAPAHAGRLKADVIFGPSRHRSNRFSKRARRSSFRSSRKALARRGQRSRPIFRSPAVTSC